MSESYPIHPACLAMPAMSHEDYKKLRDDIRLHGLLQTVELLDGQVIDGRHRLQACEDLGIEPTIADVEIAPQTPWEYVWSLNGCRRHLTPSQLACVAAKFLPSIEEEAKERQTAVLKKGTQKPVKSPVVAKLPQREQLGSKSREIAAKRVGVSPKYVSDAKRIEEADEQLFAEVHTGAKTLQKAKRELASRGESQPAPAKEKPFDRDKMGSRLGSWLRTELAKWPQEELHHALHQVQQIITEEYKA